MIERIYSFLGLAARARKLISGDETCERTIRLEKARLVIVSEDASDNTKKKFADMCNYRNVELRVFGLKQSLGKYTGKEIRSVIAITDTGFAERLKEMIDSNGLEHGGVRIGK